LETVCVLALIRVPVKIALVANGNLRSLGRPALSWRRGGLMLALHVCGQPV
jgi:hypothetical protein